MPFPIRCPRGCLLTVDESQAGWQCQCPMCGSLFIVPPPPAAPMAGPSPYSPQRPPFNPYQPNPQGQPQQFAATPYSPDPQAPAPGHFQPTPQQPANPFQPPPATSAKSTAPEPAPVAETPPEPAKEPEPKKEVLYHIPCPNGHELEVPQEMLEQEAMCPHCQAQFRLRKKNSVEYQEERRKRAESRAENAGDIWLKGAIVMAVIVVIGLIVMIVMSSS
jgi:hypothetical protein